MYLQSHPGVYRTNDEGRAWVSIESGLPSDFGFPMVAHPRRGDTIFTFPLTSDEFRVPPGGVPRIWRSRDAGKTWQQVRTPVQTGLTGSAVLGDGRIALVSQDGRVLLSADNGGSFESLPSTRPMPLFGVAAAGNGGLALVGARGVRMEDMK